MTTKRTPMQVLSILLVTCVYYTQVYADYGYGGESDIGSFFDSGAGILIKTVGSGVFLWGLITAWIEYSADHKVDMSRVWKPLVGGAGLFMSKQIVQIIKTLTKLV